jgi:hypothetical protein
MSRIKSLLLFALAVQLPLASATITYAVGTCQPKLPSFATIQSALDASPSPNLVKVCPGSYGEQVVIGNPVTLEGVSASNAGEVNIVPPFGGLVVNATNDLGQPMAAQVSVQSSGAVNLTNLTVDGSFNDVTASNVNVVGVFYRGSPGTLNHVTVQNQYGNGHGVAVWLEGGIPVPSVIVENSYLQWADNAVLYMETNSSLSELTATISGNGLTGSYPNSFGIELLQGTTATVSNNLIAYMAEGVFINGGKGSVSKNKVVSSGVGIDLESDGVSVASNTIYDGTGLGIGIIANSAVAAVTENTIAQSNYAIIFDCVAGNNVHSNTILDSFYGLYSLPNGALSANKYYNVGTISTGGC